MQKRYKATGALLVSVAGFIFTYPYTNAGFSGGLINNGFLAAMIGGLADWFAVTALFRKPLGISYHTQILVRNRKRIMDAIVDFASDDLLNSTNIMKVVHKQDTAQMLVNYLENKDGRDKLKYILDALLTDVVRKLDTKSIGRELDRVVRRSLDELSLAESVLQIVKKSLKQGYADDIVFFLLEIAKRSVVDPELQIILRENISVIKARYENNSLGRMLLIQAMDLSEERLCVVFTNELLAYLEELKDPGVPARGELRLWMENKVTALEADRVFRADFLRWWAELVNHIHVDGLISEWLDQHVRQAESVWLPKVNAFIDEKIDTFAADKRQQLRCDSFIKRILAGEIDRHHDFINQLIRERLEEFTDENLVVFVESRVADDLQMIRINGSIVGSIVGMLLYTVAFVVERMWG
jgi:uncharacterized membrane-anchored protein YjiN (DUF445 family)